MISVIVRPSRHTKSRTRMKDWIFGAEQVLRRFPSGRAKHDRTAGQGYGADGVTQTRSSRSMDAPRTEPNRQKGYQQWRRVWGRTERWRDSRHTAHGLRGERSAHSILTCLVSPGHVESCLVSLVSNWELAWTSVRSRSSCICEIGPRSDCVDESEKRELSP